MWRNRRLNSFLQHDSDQPDQSVRFILEVDLFGFGDGVEKAEEGVDAGNFEGVEDAFVDADQGEGASGFAVADVGADQSADAGGIDIGDAAEVDDEEAVFLGPQGGLKLEQGGENDRALQTENALAGLGAGEILDGEGFVRYRRHPAILAFGAGVEYYRNVNSAGGWARRGCWVV